MVIAPESLVAKEGGAVLVGRMRNNDMSDGRTPKDVARMVVYLIDRILEREDAQLNGIIVFHDLKGLSRNNIHPAIPKLLLKGIIGHFPLKIKGIYFMNSPWFFKSFFSVVTAVLFSNKLKERTHFVESPEVIYAVIEKEKLLEEHGGDLQFDADAWVEKQCAREKKGDFESLHGCVVVKSSIN